MPTLRVLSTANVDVPSRESTFVKIHIAGLPIEPLAASGALGIPPREGLLVHPVTLEAIALDTVGFACWKALRAVESREQATVELATRFGVEQERIAHDLDVFLDQLSRHGLVIAEDVWSDTPAVHSPQARVRVTAILASHDRRAFTLRCLRSLFACVPPGCELGAVLVDDGSVDGTATAVGELGLPVEIVHGSGDWYWSRSMAEAEKVAERGDPDVVLWLNDDVELDPTALGRLLRAYTSSPDAILVGALWSPRRGDVSFTGLRHVGEQGSAQVRRVAPSRQLQVVDQFHGNFVAVPRSVRRTVGTIDGSWPHHYADLDYAYRAQVRGVQAYLLPGIVGVCEPESATWLDPDVPWRDRVSTLFGRKGWPPRAQWRFQRRHGITGLRDGMSTYAEVLTGASVRRPPRARLLRISRSSPDPEDQFGPVNGAPQAWAPTLAADLICLGPTSDGGYVVSRGAVVAATHLISGGRADDWRFEEAFRELKPTAVTVYDGTRGWTFWVATTWHAVTRLLRGQGRERAGDLGIAAKYRRFFGQPGVTHVPRNLTATGETGVGLLQTIDAVTGGDIFVKLDIEGGEYELFGSLLARRERITGLVVEVHMVGECEQEVADFNASFDSHTLTFVRANNAGGAAGNGRPRTLEMTWTRRDLFVEGDPELAPVNYQDATWVPGTHL